MKGTKPLELWGGVECTMNRVGDGWMDQLDRAGHLERTGDLAMIGELGVRKLRYGLVWERAVKAGTLSVFDAPVEEMRQAGIAPIAGLVHHGSGPKETSLLDPDFGAKLADYAYTVAERYPWIDSYTPVNEPHTTARFSGMYGHWYPHHRSFESFARCMMNELKASVLAMRAVRQVNPNAQFVHTEDGGRTWSTPELAGLCATREQRKWLGMDLLCGRVDESHPMFRYLRKHGVTAQEILWFADKPCPPSVCGLNYYLTSDRFLDHRTDLYPPDLRGGDNGREPLVDIEAVRLRLGGVAGITDILTEAWQRYHIPVAVTEAHLGGTPEDQVRWLKQIWHGAQQARRAGVDCVAVTVWAMLGSFDWASLVTRDEGFYEPGVFDVRGGTPVPTPLTDLVRRLAAGEDVEDDCCGWWNGDERFTFDPVSELEMDREMELEAA